MLLRIFIPKQSVAANKVYFGLFLPGNSTYRAELVSLQPVVSGSGAVVGVLGVDLMLTRITTAPTGGAAATYGAAVLTDMQISNAEGGAEINAAAITGMLGPSGGGGAGAVLSQASVFTEETSAAAYSQSVDLANSKNDFVPGVSFNPGTGIRVVQGAVASVGSIGFNAIVNLMLI